MFDRKSLFSILWVFATFNYVYADVETSLDSSVMVNLTQLSLLGAAVLVESAILMVLLSRILPYAANRWANIAVGALNTVAVASSLAVAAPHAYYAFFASIEIITTLLIIALAWRWVEPAISKAESPPARN